MGLRSCIAFLAVAPLASDCAHYPKNARTKNPHGGYRFSILSHAGNSDGLLVWLAFSCVGKPAAALSYSLLEELGSLWFFCFVAFCKSFVMSCQSQVRKAELDCSMDAAGTSGGNDI